MSRNQRLGLIGLAVAVAVVAFILASGGSSKVVTTSGSAAHVQVVNAQPKGGIAKLVFKKGGRVRFSVTSDVADEIHVHGYDLHKNVTKNGTVSFDFLASIDGVFVVELEGRKEQIASLQVQP